jgi:hypothetical protein
MGSLETALNALDLSTLRNGLDIAHKCRRTLRERSASASIVRTI